MTKKDWFKTTSLAAVAIAIPALASTSAIAQDDTIVVTGSYIQGTAEDAALPVDVIGADELIDQGTPTINDILRNLPATQGLIGETNQFDTRGGQSNEGVSTINLRGLGSARTLVLLNGKRHVAAPAIGVDVTIMPVSAIQRLEVLKDGAAALYGSDAIGGVVNFITRDDFEGLEVRGSYTDIQDTDGEFELGAIVGKAGDGFNLMGAIEYSERSELRIADRDWAIKPFADNPQGGYSSIGNPGTFFDLVTLGGGTVLPVADPNCDALGGVNAGFLCRFQFTNFDNLIEDTETLKLFGTATFELEEHELRFEGAYSEVDVPNWATSPAYPPQSLFGATNWVLPDHPGRIAFEAANPGFASFFNPAGPAVFFGRYTGVAGVNGGDAERGSRTTEQMRFGAGLSGPAFDGSVNYDLSLNWSKRDRTLINTDMVQENFGLAMRGLGGPNCDPATGTPGVGSCEYFNPYSNAIEFSVLTGAANPAYDASVANSPELLAWLTEETQTDIETELFVADLVFNGDTSWTLGGGTVGYAVGAQIRNDKYAIDATDNFNISLNPCPFNNPVSVTLGFTADLDCTTSGATTGRFAFLAGVTPDSFDRTVYGAFGELALPFSDTFDVQLAARFEDYGDSGGSTFDPKLAARWQATPEFAVRGSISSTFRGPELSSTLGRTTALEFVAPTNAFKALDTVANPDLDPETAIASNLGVLFDNGKFKGSVDYWRFDFEKPFQLESAGQLVAAYTANGCEDGGAGVGSAACNSLRSQIFPTGTAASGIERIERQVINGSDIVTDGIDFFGSYEFDAGQATLTVGGEATYTLSYESDDFLNADGITLAPGGDFVGFLNEGTPFQPLIEWRGNAFVKMESGPHDLNYTLRYTGDYEDPSSTVTALASIDSHVTHDVTYNYSLNDGKTRLSASVYNLTDEDPPATHQEINYDPFTHNPFGRMIKVGVVHEFGN